jgi:DNA repair photolyase
MNRIREEVCLVPNPFNAKQISRISLAPEDVDAFVFWSKNPRPMMAHLDELDDRGLVYYFQYTLNDYPSALEPSVPGLQRRLDTFEELSNRLGPERVVWRYDPIIITPVTNYDFHATTFERLARSLRGMTRRSIISMVDLYRKTDRRMAALANDGFAVDRDAANHPEMLEMLSHIARIAQEEEMVPFSCAEEADYSRLGIRAGSCIDSELIQSLGGHAASKKDPGQRSNCRCVVSRDIGINDTCLHGCPYCYSTGNNQRAFRRNAQHNPVSPVLFGDAVEPTTKKNSKQLELL